MSEVSADWLLATLIDAQDALAEAVTKLEDHPDSETAAEILRRDLVAAYAKLNYAVNTAELGPEALNVMSEDALIAWPAGMPFLTVEELEAAEAEEAEEAEEGEAADEAGR